MLKDQSVLFFTRSMQQGGTENVVLQLCEILKPKTKKIVVCSNGGVNVERLNKMGITHYHIADIEKKDVWTFVTVLISLVKIVKNEKISIVHTHHRMAAFYMRLIHFFYKFVFISTAHNTFYNKKWLTQFSYKKSRVIACGQQVKKNLVEYFGIERENVDVICNSVKKASTAIGTTDLTHLKNDGCILIGNIGRLSKQKGMDVFIKSYLNVKAKVKNIKYIIVGEGEDEEKLKKLVYDIQADEDIIFLGYRTDIPYILSQLDFLVLSSLWEGFPLTPIEAFSVGIPVVATAVDGTIEIVKDMENGLLVKPNDYDDLAAKIIYMSSYTNERERMSIMARKSYEKNFSYESFTKAYLDVYDKCVENF